MHHSNSRKALVVSVNMGLGHQRAAYPFLDIAEEVKIANDYEGIPSKDRRIWEWSRKAYETLSNFTRVPFIGRLVLNILDDLTEILNFYPRRNMAAGTVSLRLIFRAIKKGWGKDLIDRFKKTPLPLISTFFTPAFMADFYKYPKNIYCVVTDTDVSRVWVSLHPKKSKIIYFAPTREVLRHLISYGVPEERAILTGFPLPKENLGDAVYTKTKTDLSKRLSVLDSTGIFRQSYDPLIEKYVGRVPTSPQRKPIVMFSIGGAGAQKELALTILKSLVKHLRDNDMKFIIAIGVKNSVRKYFEQNIHILGLQSLLNHGSLELLGDERPFEYFKMFNDALRSTDVLWTKPSELSFYAGLGIPIIIAPPLGSQEIYNREWLIKIGAGVDQKDPRYADEWLPDLINDGTLAEAALQGFVKVEKGGTYNIERIVKELAISDK